jgi:hypothetical protein
MDIFDALARTRHTFLQANLKPPTVMLLESHEQGMRFLHAVRQKDQFLFTAGSPDLGHEVQMADGSYWMEINVMGIAVRWPACRLATQDGTWRHV